jgi:hypothetical protein
MNTLLISTLLCAVTNLTSRPQLIDEMVVTAVASRPLVSAGVLIDLKQAPAAIAPEIDLPALQIALPALEPAGG